MTIVFCLLLAAQQPPAPRQPTPAVPRPPAAAQARRAAPSAGTMEVHVTDRTGVPAAGAHVLATGPTTREGTTDASGLVTFRTMTAGTYRVRAEADGLVALEKELAVKGGPPMVADFPLSAAPKPPEPEPKPEAPPPPPPPATPTGISGEPRMLSIPDLAERSLSGRDPIKILPIGCTGVSASRLIVLREAIPKASADVDETIYLVAGEATLTLGGKEQALTPGWFSVVPKGTTVGITRKGRNPAILLSIVYGKPCTANGGAQP
jgi:Carboxypeptidase regulatory-like domain